VQISIRLQIVTSQKVAIFTFTALVNPGFSYRFSERNEAFERTLLK